MGVLEDINAAVADGALTEDQRRSLIRRLRAEEWQRIEAALPVSRTFTATISGVQRSVTVTVIAIVRNEGNVTLYGSDNRSLISWPIVVQNPPLLVPDPLGPIDRDGTKYRLDAAQALRDVIRHVALDAASRR